MFLLETQLTREEVAGLSVLDAGCGNGELTEAIASLGADVTGIDLSTSINRITPKNAKFIQADINNPPFPPASFDVIFSSGVLHHNSNARASFDSLAKLCKENGRMYVWLYKNTASGLKNRIVRLREAIIRPICCRLPHSLQVPIVKADAFWQWLLTRFVGKKRTYAELVVASYDALTPRYAWKHHTPLDLARWFYENGFSAPIITHWDNPNGYGVVAIRRPQASPPGLNFKHSDFQSSQSRRSGE